MLLQPRRHTMSPSTIRKHSAPNARKTPLTTVKASGGVYSLSIPGMRFSGTRADVYRDGAVHGKESRAGGYIAGARLRDLCVVLRGFGGFPWTLRCIGQSEADMEGEVADAKMPTVTVTADCRDPTELACCWSRWCSRDTARLPHLPPPRLGERISTTPHGHCSLRRRRGSGGSGGGKKAT